MGKKTWEKDLRVEDFLNLGREDEMEIERLSEILIRLEARAKRVTAVYRQSGGGKGEDNKNRKWQKFNLIFWKYF